MNDPKTQFVSFPGTIHLIENNQQMAALSNKLEKIEICGFDTETRPSFKKGEVYKVALLQLATDEDAFLIRLQRINEFSLIKKILESEQIIKVGAAIRDDLKLLKKTFDFNPQSFVELQHIAEDRGLENFGLKGMAEEVLSMTLTKGPKLTNWEAYELTDQQLMYAATDAWIGLKIYQKLMN